MTSVLSGGRLVNPPTLAGHISLSVEGPRQCLGEDFALMEVSYTIVRLLQTFPYIVLPKDEPNGPIGTETQSLTLVLSSAEGCRVDILSND